MPIAEYLLLVKQVQTVLLFNPRKGIPRQPCLWLQRRPRANSVGLPSLLYNVDQIFKRPPFVKLVYPHGNVARFYAELSPDVPDYVRESVVLGSCYAVPVLVLEPELLTDLQPAILWERHGQPFSESELSGYLSPSALSVPEFVEIAEETFYALRDFVHGHTAGEEILDIAEQRRELACSYAQKRFGASVTDAQFPVIMACVDPLRFILPWLLKGKREMLETICWDDLVATGLSIVWALIAHPTGQFRERHSRRRRRSSSRASK